MVKNRRMEQQFDQRRELGLANVDVIRKADKWCKHLDVEMTSAGMLAEMWNLPIGSHLITCPHAVHGMEGMNLPWILREFLEKNCRGCPHHAPDGDASWGEAILREREAQRQDYERRQRDMRRQVEEVRQRLRALPHQAKTEAALSEQQILHWAEQLFDDNSQKAQDASRRLGEACAVAADLFSETTVSVLVSAASFPPFHHVCLPVVVELAARRPDLHGRLATVAASVLQADLGVEEACAILLHIGSTQSDSLAQETLSQIVAQQRHVRPLGGWPTRDPKCNLVDIAPVYPHSLQVLAREFDRQPDVVLEVLRTRLSVPDKDTRVNTCGLIQEMLGHRQPLVRALLAPLADSLELDDDHYGDSADQAAQEALREAFFLEPAVTDQFLADRIAGRTGEVQSLLIKVYGEVLCSHPADETSSPRAAAGVQATITMAFERCLALLQGSSLDLDQMLEVIQAIRSGCRKHPNVALRHFLTLFGTLANLSLRADAPRPPPRILTLDRLAEHPGLAQLEQQGRQSRWQQIKRELGQCLERLVEVSPATTADSLVESFGGLDSQKHATLKAEIVRLLGILGRNNSFLGKVIHPLWIAYMDPSSTLLRARGIEAMNECFGHEGRTPPANVIDALLVHLCDTFVIVHRAAIRVIGDKADWFSCEQSVQALGMLCQLAQVYKTEDCLQLEPIARSLLAVSQKHPMLRSRAVQQVVSLLPTGERFVDRDLIGLLLSHVGPNEPAAQLVAAHAAQWLGASEDDAGYYRGGERQVFSWLHQLPPDFYQKIEQALVSRAEQVTARNFHRIFSFASLFGAFGKHAAEATVLEHACAGVPTGDRYQSVRDSLETLAEGARLNANRQARKVPEQKRKAGGQ